MTGSTGTTYDWDVPCHASEDDGRNKHDDEDDPVINVSTGISSSSIVLKL